MPSSLASTAAELQSASIPWGPLEALTLPVRRRQRARLVHGDGWCEMYSAQSSEPLRETRALPDALLGACDCLRLGEHRRLVEDYLHLASTWAAHLRHLQGLELERTGVDAAACSRELLRASAHHAAAEEDLRALRDRCFNPTCSAYRCTSAARASAGCTQAEEGELARTHEPLRAFAEDVTLRLRQAVATLRAHRAQSPADALMLREVCTEMMLRDDVQGGNRVGAPVLSDGLTARLSVLSSSPGALRDLWLRFARCCSERAGGDLEDALALARAQVEAYAQIARFAAFSQLPAQAPSQLPGERFDHFVERVWREELDAVLGLVASEWAERLTALLAEALGETRRLTCALLGSPAELTELASSDRSLACVLAAEPLWDPSRRLALVSLHPLTARFAGATSTPRFFSRRVLVELDDRPRSAAALDTALAVAELPARALTGSAPEELLPALHAALELADCALAA